jgi:hypothetical protein
MSGGFGGDYINKGIDSMGANTRVSSKACVEKLGALKRIRPDISIAL